MSAAAETAAREGVARSWIARVLRSPSGAIGATIIGGVVLLAILAGRIAPYSPLRMGAGRPLLMPSLAYPFGTDEFGRDEFSRVLFGTRLTLMVGAVAVGISLIVGLTLAALAGLARGWREKAIMRMVDVLFSFTDTLIALACVAVLGASLRNSVIAVGIAAIPFYARTAHAAVIVERSKPYFEAAEAAGAGPLRLALRHLLPNIAPTMIVVATLGVSTAILAAAALSFLGLGAEPPAPEWGLMLSGARSYMDRAPWLMLFPGFAIALTVLGFNLFGDALRDAFDPRRSSR
jgi:ABC-type dipeptide/oligopeptide/nickel transport system permease subunit